MVLHHEKDLGERVDTRSGLGVTNVGLDGTEVDRLVGLPLAVAGSEDVGDRGHLNTVTGLSTSTVHLDVADLVSINTSVSEDLLVKELLSTSVRVGDGDGLSRVVGGSAQNATKDVVLVVDGILVTLEDDSTASVTTAVTIGSVVVGLARTGLGQELTLGKTRENVRVGQDVETTGASSVAVTSPQGSAGELDGSERRRAGGVDGVRRARELEVVVDATRSEGTHTTGDVVGVDVLGGVDLTPIVGSLTVEGTNTVKLGGRSTVGDVTRHLECLVGSHEGKTTHGVSLSSLTRRHVEEARVEKTGLVDEAAEGAVRLVLALARRVAVSISVEAIGGDSAVNVETLHEKIPKSLVAGSVRVTTGHTNDGDLVVLSAAESPLLNVSPAGVVGGGDISLATGLERRHQRVGDVADTDGEDLGAGFLGSHLGDSLLEEVVPANGLLQHRAESSLDEVKSVLGRDSLASDCRVDHGRRVAGLELLSKVADDLVDVGIAVKVLGVVRSVDRDGNALSRGKKTRLEETLGGGGRARDGDCHHGNGAHVGLGGERDAGLLVESVEGLLGSRLGGAGADGAPAGLLLTSEDHGLLSRVDHGTAAERQADEVDRKRDEVRDILCRDSGSSRKETGAETDHASALRGWKLIRVLGEVTNEVAKLGDGGESSLEHGNLVTLLVVEIEQVVDGHEVGELLLLARRQLLDLIAEGSRSALQEGGQTGIASTEDSLAEQWVLLGGLIAKEENVGHDGCCWWGSIKVVIDLMCRNLVVDID